MDTKYSVTLVVVEADEAIAEELMSVVSGIAKNFDVQEEFSETHHTNQLDCILAFSNAEDAFRFLENAIEEIPDLIISSVQLMEEEPCISTTAEPS